MDKKKCDCGHLLKEHESDEGPCLVEDCDCDEFFVEDPDNLGDPDEDLEDEEDDEDTFDPDEEDDEDEEDEDDD